MNCSDLQTKYSPYIDAVADADEITAVENHLSICPLCRQQIDEIRELRTGLRQFSRPEIPVAVRNRVKLAVRANLRRGKAAYVPSATFEWLQMRVMPYAAGVAVSMLVGFTLLTMMFSGYLVPPGDGSRGAAPDTRVLLAANTSQLRGDNSNDILPADYARSRMAVGSESPSINPQGALIALSRSIVRGNMKDDEVVVVADVFANGLARISQVVEPSGDPRAAEQLETALETDASNAPFVPAVLDNRSDSVRVVLKFRTVDVNSKPARRRN